MAFYKKKVHKKLQFSHHNSRIDFGTLIFEASKQKDAEGLELILSQKGGNVLIIIPFKTIMLAQTDHRTDRYITLLTFLVYLSSTAVHYINTAGHDGMVSVHIA